MVRPPRCPQAPGRWLHMPLVAPESRLLVASLLSATGGFLDAFTWVGHGGVFANAQSGNVVLLGVSLASADWAQALRHIPPILAFLVGVYTASWLRFYEQRRGGHRTGAFTLGVEIVLLLAVALLPRRFPDLPIVLGIAFVAALQNSSFTVVEGLSFNSVMTTGNLRRTAEMFFAGMTGPREPDAMRQAWIFARICSAFAAGAGTGAFCTVRAGNAALLVPAVALAVAFWLCRDSVFGASSGPRL
jgi:uncharacterized membrane protein YoaK (UPF0700 family)